MSAHTGDVRVRKEKVTSRSGVSLGPNEPAAPRI